MNAPPGLIRAARTPWFDLDECTGHRAVLPEGGAPMTMDTYHDLASVTKVVATTTMLIRLVSDRLVDLDAPLSAYLPKSYEAITVRDLLLHRGGLWEWWPLYIQPQLPPPRYRPGRARHYSDLGFILLGRIVAQVTGLRLDRALAELVTRPLGLTSTTYARPAGSEVAMSALDDRVEMTMLDTGRPYPVPYRSGDFARWRTGPVVGEVADGNAFHALDGVAGHAGLFSTVPDLLKYGLALARYEEYEHLWRPEVVREFLAPGPDQEQALGFRRYALELPGETVTVLGHPGYVGCAVGFVPGRDIALALASNRLLVEGTPTPTGDLWTALLQDIAHRTGTA
ncbi:serine hydrolase domain-containing protein [Nonomuraea rubra]|uniref:CubicO group peptidase (Beta-lactamase class C family) n=2 Tax=Nonomuraea rubra TaxID=46180 RepID=A0A7X0NSS0_9ACTN|nr:serine hydrolase domain-containing protein [Nonomuraea rubra]MBB6548875.1 CubicO group peptidase (beta-lactamase class C family) [Nonomuraea rubra]